MIVNGSADPGASDIFDERVCGNRHDGVRLLNAGQSRVEQGDAPTVAVSHQHEIGKLLSAQKSVERQSLIGEIPRMARRCARRPSMSEPIIEESRQPGGGAQTGGEIPPLSDAAEAVVEEHEDRAAAGRADPFDMQKH